MKIAGFRDHQIRRVNVDDRFRMDAGHLAELVNRDFVSNKTPTFVCATIGTTSSLAVDPIPEIADIAESHGIWLHVDAAYSGSATVCPEFRYMLDGIRRVNSYCFNPHKWQLTNFDCDLFYVANKATESGAVFDYSGWQASLGRRFRSLKLWLVIRHYGRKV